MRRQAQKRLREVGKIVTEQAKREAEMERLRSSRPDDHHQGALIKQIRPAVRGASVFIRDNARTPGSGKWANYNYPARFEFQDGGRRSFLRRALETKRPAVVHEMEKIVDWVADEWGR